jgi:hypothetical protein
MRLRFTAFLGLEAYIDGSGKRKFKVEFPNCVEAPLMKRNFSRKGAKAQSAAAFLKSFLCAFAPLRERSSPASLLQHRLCFTQVQRVEALGETIIDFRQ